MKILCLLVVLVTASFGVGSAAHAGQASQDAWGHARVAEIAAFAAAIGREGAAAIAMSAALAAADIAAATAIALPGSGEAAATAAAAAEAAIHAAEAAAWP